MTMHAGSPRSHHTAKPVVLPADHMLDGLKNDMWVQEAIYGHRFKDEQKPFMLVLEALAICAGRNHAGVEMFPGLPADGKHESISSYGIESQALRRLLFWRSIDEAVAEAGRLRAGNALEHILARLEEDFPQYAVSGTFRHLRERTNGDWEGLMQAVRIVRGAQIDPENDKRGTSQFLNPLGPSMMLTEMKENSTTTDRRFFARGGELIYLMLNRSDNRARVGAAIERRFLRSSDAIDALAARLIGEDAAPFERAKAKLGYLPLSWMPAYDRLAEDWLTVLEQEGIPRSQLLGLLARATAINVVRYFAEAGHLRQGVTARSIPLDMTDGTRSDMRDICTKMLRQHQDSVREATRKQIDWAIAESLDWDAFVVKGSHADARVLSENARNAIQTALHANLKEPDDVVLSPEEWRRNVVQKAVSRTHGNPASVIQPLGKAAGFIEARRGTGTFFCASDAFLEALVLMRVTTAVPLEEFISDLHERYGIVIGPAEATAHMSGLKISEASFRRNLAMLEERLAGLGYLQRLSDDCAFVVNPFAAEEQR